MSYKDQEKLDTLRKRLYERGRSQTSQERHGLSDIKEPVTREWKTPPNPNMSTQKQEKQDMVSKTPISEENLGNKARHETEFEPTMAKTPRKKKYRMRLLLVGVVFFVVAIALASIFIIFGGKTISGENITVDVSGPFAIGGGEEFPLQIVVANQNAVPIESATLIVEYPFGTQSSSDEGKEIFIERFSLETIDPGEIVNVPVRVIVFGEENDEKEIKVSIEYRVRGSNATFFKEAESLRFKISTSPVVLQIESVERISSGQELEITLTAISNSPTSLQNLLVEAQYPFGFDVSNSEPKTVSGNNTWSISNLEPGNSTTIVVRGLLIGKENDESTFNFTIGVPNERDPFSLASIFMTVEESVKIEQPFLALDVTINKDNRETVVIEPGDRINTTIKFENTLSDPLFDTVIKVSLGGSGLSETQISAGTGFYDSIKNTITWDKNAVSELEEILPGVSRQVSFNIEPSSDAKRTPQVTMTMDVKSLRVFENRSSEVLAGTASRVVRVASEATLVSSSEYGNSIFTNSGPIPPIAEQTTTYTVNMRVDNTSNELTGAVVTAQLPSYVEWRNVVSSGDTMTFDTRDRIITWNIAQINAGGSDSASFQVAITPSKSQIDSSPIIVNSQQFRASDKFTGTVIRATASTLTTELPEGDEQERGNGKVLAKPSV